MNGGVSVAERARIFGAQVTHSSPPKNPKPPPNPRIQWPPVNNQSTTSNNDRQERNDPRPKQQTY